MKDILIKKPQQKRSKQKFEAIMAASTRVLAEEGFKKTTTAKIALEAEVGIGTLYDYFSCKEAILIAYIDDRLSKAMEHVSYMAQDKELSPEKTLKELIRVGINFAYEYREVIKIIFTHFPSDAHLISLNESRARLEDIALQFANSKNIALREKPARLMIYTLTNLVLGFQFRIVVMPDEAIERDEIVEEITEVVSAYLFH